jgi:hypothetical protein
LCDVGFRLILAAILALSSAMGGVALGSYTIGGFRVFERPPDVLFTLADAAGRPEASRPAPMVPSGVTHHVCTGCDAGLRDRDAVAGAAHVDEWALEDDHGRWIDGVRAPAPEEAAISSVSGDRAAGAARTMAAIAGLAAPLRIPPPRPYRPGASRPTSGQDADMRHRPVPTVREASARDGAVIVAKAPVQPFRL